MTELRNFAEEPDIHGIDLPSFTRVGLNKVTLILLCLSVKHMARCLSSYDVQNHATEIY